MSQHVQHSAFGSVPTFASAPLRRFAAAAALAAGVLTLSISWASAATLRAVLGGDLQVLDPIASTSYPSRTFGYLVYDTLVSRDTEGKLEPQMLDSWTISPDGMTYTFVLRDNLKWSDGTAVTAEDCVASLQRWAKRDGLGGQMMSVTKSLEARDEKTFVLTLSEPFGLVIEALGKESSPVPFMMPKNLASTEATKALEIVNGSGPFLFKKDEFVPGSVASFVPNPNYKPRSEPADGFAGGKVAKVDRVELVSMADTATQVSALQTGEIDYVQYPAFDLMDILKSDDNIKVVDPGPAAGNMGFVRPNHLQAPFTDPKARQALAYAINRKDVLAAVGVSESDMRPDCVSMFGCGGPYEARKGGEDYTGDTAETAKKLLKEAGYKGEEIVLLSQQGGVGAAAAPVVAEQLRAVGFNVRLELMELNKLFERRASKAPVTEGGWSAFLVFLGAGDIASPATHLYINNNCNPNYAGWSCDEEMKKLLDAFRSEPDYQKRRDIADLINVRAYGNVPAALWGAYASPIAYRKELSNLIEKTSTPVFWNVEKK